MQIFTGHTNRVNDVAFSLDGKSLASCSTDGTVRVWDCLSGNGDILLQVEQSINEVGSVVFVAGAELIVRFRWRGLQVWDIGSKNCVAELRNNFNGAIDAFAVSQDGDRVAILELSEHSVNHIEIWQATNWKQEATLRLNQDLTSSGLAFDPSGVRLATSAGVFGARTGLWLTSIGYRGETLIWSSDGSLIAGSGFSGKTVEVFSATTGNAVHTITLDFKQVQDFAFSPDAASLVVVSNEETVRIWNTRTWEEQPALAWGIGKLKCIAFSPDGTRAACGSDRGTILVWDWEE